MFRFNTHLILFDSATKPSISRFPYYKEKNYNFFPYKKEIHNPILHQLCIMNYALLIVSYLGTVLWLIVTWRKLLMNRKNG